MPPAMTRHPQHDHLLMLWVFNRRGSCCSLFRKPLVTPQPKPGSKRLRSHRRRSQRVRIPAARLHGCHLHLSWCPGGAAAILFPNFSLKRQTHTGALHPADRPQRACVPPQHSPPHLYPISIPATAQPSSLRGRGSPAFRSQSRPEADGPEAGERALRPGRGGSDMAAGREGEGAREPPGGWSQAAPPEPAASRRVQTSGSWRAAALLGAVPPAPGASACAYAQARRRQVRALPLAAGGLLRCGAAPLEQAGARFGNKQQRAVFPNPSAPAAGRGVGVCARGEARRGEVRREAGCGLRPRVPRFTPTRRLRAGSPPAAGRAASAAENLPAPRAAPGFPWKREERAAASPRRDAAARPGGGGCPLSSIRPVVPCQRGGVVGETGGGCGGRGRAARLGLRRR